MHETCQTGTRDPCRVLRCSRKLLSQVWFLLMAGMFALAPFRADAMIELTFGTYAADKPSDTVRKYRPFLGFLADSMQVILGEPVQIKLRIAKDYNESIEDLASGRVDFSRFGPASYIHALELNSDIQIIAMESKLGRKRFKGIIAVHKDSDIKTIADLRGGSFAFGDELSTIGRYLSQAYLLDAGLSSSDFADYQFLGRHDLVGEAVGAGKFSAGALKESTFKQLIAKGVPIRALASFDNVTKPWLAAPDLEPRVVDAMRSVMLSTHNEEILKRVSKSGFVVGTTSDYDIIRDAMRRSQDF